MARSLRVIAYDRFGDSRFRRKDTIRRRDNNNEKRRKTCLGMCTLARLRAQALNKKREGGGKTIQWI